MKIKTLIHTALVAEAKPIIGYFGLTCKEKIPYNLYENENIVLIVSGIGEELTQQALSYALSLYEPEIAINIGIAGCSDATIARGTLFCTTHENLDIPFATLSSHKEGIDASCSLNTVIHDGSPETLCFIVPSERKCFAQTSSHAKLTTLVDMEAESFLHTIPKDIETYVFKVVSDHLQTSIPSKADVGNWINKSIKQWEKYVRR